MSEYTHSIVEELAAGVPDGHKRIMGRRLEKYPTELTHQVMEDFMIVYKLGSVKGIYRFLFEPPDSKDAEKTRTPTSKSLSCKTGSY